MRLEAALDLVANEARAELAIPREESHKYLPATVIRAGEKAQRRFLEFFAATIRNKNLHTAYYRAVCKFFCWCEERRLRELHQVEPMIVAAFIEEECNIRQAQTVKQELAAMRKLFDYLVTGQIVPFNPAASVRGPSYSLDEGKTPVLSPDEARRLLERIAIYKDGEGARKADLVGLRDRALIGLMVYSFSRISAVVNMKVSDYRQNGKRFQVQLHEKGGNSHHLPVHHKAEEYLDEYLEAAGIGDEKKTPLFRSSRERSGQLTDKGLCRRNALHIIKRRAQAVGLPIDICCHTFRATGITAYLLGGGSIESA
jgi:site-specific recombinase XerD